MPARKAPRMECRPANSAMAAKTHPINTTMVKPAERSANPARCKRRPMRGKIRIPSPMHTPKKMTAFATTRNRSEGSNPFSPTIPMITAKIINAPVSQIKAAANRTLAIRVPNRSRSTKIRDLVAREVTPMANPRKRDASVSKPKAFVTVNPSTNGMEKPPAAAKNPPREALIRAR